MNFENKGKWFKEAQDKMAARDTMEDPDFLDGDDKVLTFEEEELDIEDNDIEEEPAQKNEDFYKYIDDVPTEEIAKALKELGIKEPYATQKAKIADKLAKRFGLRRVPTPIEMTSILDALPYFKDESAQKNEVAPLQYVLYVNNDKSGKDNAYVYNDLNSAKRDALAYEKQGYKTSIMSIFKESAQKNEVRYINPDNLDRYDPNEIEEVTTKSGEKRYKRKSSGSTNEPVEKKEVKTGRTLGTQKMQKDDFDKISTAIDELKGEKYKGRTYAGYNFQFATSSMHKLLKAHPEISDYPEEDREAIYKKAYKTFTKGLRDSLELDSIYRSIRKSLNLK